jgi:hypothetical protein
MALWEYLVLAAFGSEIRVGMRIKRKIGNEAKWLLEACPNI